MLDLKLKKIARFVLDVLFLSTGLLYYVFHQKKPIRERTPSKSYLAMIRLFCLTSGRSNDILSKCISLIDKPISLPDSKGVLGDLCETDLKAVNSTLNKQGFYIFPEKLSVDSVNELFDFASKQEFDVRPLDGDTVSSPQKSFYDRNDLKGTVYQMPTKTILSHPIVQSLMRDHSLLSVAQQYLGCAPKMDITALWWSTPYTDKPQVNSAQLFHYDMDRIKWLKFFIFLTDVTLENGPHVFVEGSHRTHGIPRDVLKAGYERHSDEMILKHYSKEAIKTFTVPAGTIVAEDTRGLHKGTNLNGGERLVLELQFSNCLFGAHTPIISPVTVNDLKLKALVNQNPKVYQLYPI